MSLSTRLSLFAVAGCCMCWSAWKEPNFPKMYQMHPNSDVQLWNHFFYYEFRFYTSKLNEICPHCHWLYFSSIILSFRQGVQSYRLFLKMQSTCHQLNQILPDINNHQNRSAVISPRMNKKSIVRVIFLLKYGLELRVSLLYKCSTLLSLLLCLKYEWWSKNIKLTKNLWCFVPGTV